MRKRGFMLAALAATGMITGSAWAIPTFPVPGSWTFDIEDRSSLYHEPSGLVTAIGGGGGPAFESAGAVGTIGLYALGVSPSVTGPLSQRSIYRLKDVNTGTDTLPGVGSFGLRQIITNTGVDSWESGSKEGTGSFTGVNLTTAAGLSALPPGPGSNDASLGLRLWYSPDPRLVLPVDAVPSTAAAKGLGGLDAAGLASPAGGFGGLVRLYEDGSVDASFSNGIGGTGWTDYGAAFDTSGAGYPKFDDGTDGSALVAIGTATPLYNLTAQSLTPGPFGVPADNAVLEALWNANFGAGSFNTAFGDPILGGFPAGVLSSVVIEDFTGAANGDGLFFINVLSATPAFLATFTPDQFGAGRDLRVDFQTTTLIGADGTGGYGTNGLPDTLNFVDTPGGGPGWNLVSTDPVQGVKVTIIPEPVTAGMGLISLGTLALFASRRRRGA